MLGHRIQLLRLQKGLSQAALARRLHISASTLGMYEQGRREPALETLVLLAQELEVTIDYLLTGHSNCQQETLCWQYLCDELHLNMRTFPPQNDSRKVLAVIIAALLLDEGIS